MSLKQTLACFPLTQRGAGTPLKTDAKRNLLIYARERTVVIRDIVPTGGQPIQVQLYTQHTCTVTAVAMAPNGCWMATGDERGMVRIWACDHPDQRMKNEEPYYMLGGKVLDLALSRLCVWAISRQYLG